VSAHYDIAIVGAGIAGASLAAELAAHGARDVVLIEAEDRPG
jgi:D-arginine dehydrogenase